MGSSNQKETPAQPSLEKDHAGESSELQEAIPVEVKTQPIEHPLGPVHGMTDPLEKARFVREKAPEENLLYESLMDKISDMFSEEDVRVAEKMKNFVLSVNLFGAAVIGQLKRVEGRSKKRCGGDESRLMHIKGTIKKVVSSKPGVNQCRHHSIISLVRLESVVKEPFRMSHILSFMYNIPTLVSTVPPLIPQEDGEPTPLDILSVSTENVPLDVYGRWVFSGFHPIPRTIETVNGPQKQIGSRGTGNEQFIKPFGIAISPINGNIYIADAGNGRVQVVSPDMKFVTHFGKQGSGPGELMDPSGVGFSLDGSLLVVVDQGNHRIHLFTHDGGFIRTIGSQGNRPGEFNKPYFATFDLENNFYVSDMRNSRVQKFNVNGEFIQYIGLEEQDSKHAVGLVCGMMINDDNELMTISNPGDIVKVWTTDGNYLREHKVELTHRLDNFLGRNIDGGFILTDYGFNKVYFYSKEGSLQKQFNFPGPVGAEFDKQGRLFLPCWSASYFTIW